MANELTRIHLGGKLGKLFGSEWTLNVSSPAEAIRAIDVNTKGAFSTYLRKDGEKKFYKVALQKKDYLLGKDELRNHSGKSDIFIMPTIKGKNSGIVKIIAGVILIVVGILLYEFGGAFFVKAGGLLIVAGLVGMGASLVLGGITQLLAPVPKKYNQAQSSNFAGNAAAVTQGQAIPLVYGRCLVKPIPIAVSFDSADTQTTSNTSRGTIDTLELIGGGYQYGFGGQVSTNEVNEEITF